MERGTSPGQEPADASQTEVGAALDVSVPTDAADAAPFVLPVPKPYDTPTCHHPALVANCRNGYCLLPKGCFLMGAPPGEADRSRYGEEQREVSFTHDLLISTYETTQAQWVAAGLPNRSMRLSNPELISDCDAPDCPVGNVTWFDAWVFANILNDRENLPHCAEPRECAGTPGGGLACKRIEQLVPSLYECRGYRLPTRSEFEYAARAGTLTEFYSGPMSGQGYGPEYHLRHIAWFVENSGNFTHPVGQKLPNYWGLYDILGNAGEWVTEEFIGTENPPGPLVDFRGVLNPTDDAALSRGGFSNGEPWALRAGARSITGSRAYGSPGGGFRLVRSLPNEADGGADASDAGADGQ
jgi:formylglycine-generating enzyme required for sulfatase activity